MPKLEQSDLFGNFTNPMSSGNVENKDYTTPSIDETIEMEEMTIEQPDFGAGLDEIEPPQ